jgi:hypothetical protein
MELALSLILTSVISLLMEEQPRILTSLIIALFQYRFVHKRRPFEHEEQNVLMSVSKFHIVVAFYSYYVKINLGFGTMSVAYLIVDQAVLFLYAFTLFLTIYLLYYYFKDKGNKIKSKAESRTVELMELSALHSQYTINFDPEQVSALKIMGILTLAMMKKSSKAGAGLKPRSVYIGLNAFQNPKEPFDLSILQTVDNSRANTNVNLISRLSSDEDRSSGNLYQFEDVFQKYFSYRFNRSATSIQRIYRGYYVRHPPPPPTPPIRLAEILDDV